MANPRSSRPPSRRPRGRRAAAAAPSARNARARNAPARNAPARNVPARRAPSPPAAPDRLLARQPWESLRPLLSGEQAEKDRVLARLRAFALELLQWNRGISNLISHADEPRLVERHIAESLAGAPVLRGLACEHIVDLGSGGGFPAIPLAIAGTAGRWTLVESRRNKTLFLRRILERLELRDIVVKTGRLEVLVESEPDALRCDGFTSRATMKAGPTLALAARIVRPGGHAILWKGSGVEQELAGAESAWRREWNEPRTHPIGDGPNLIAVFERRT